jgi:hypothetical protein
MSEHFGRRRAWQSRLAAVAAALVVIVAPKIAAADHGVTDPREYCDRMAELIAKEDLDELADDILAHANRLGNRAEINAGMSKLVPFWSKIGGLQSDKHVSEMKLGDNYMRHWYAFIYELGPLFVRCTMYRPGDTWLIIDLHYSDKPEEMGLTN